MPQRPVLLRFGLEAGGPARFVHPAKTPWNEDLKSPDAPLQGF